MSDAVIARIRTTVPALVGAALAWLATHYAIDVPADDAQAITVGLTTILTLAWYSGVQLFARRGQRELPHRALLTRVPAAVKPKMLKTVVAQLRAADVQILPTPLLEKEAFRALFHFGGFEALEANGVFGAAAARENTARYTRDVIDLLQGEASQRDAAPPFVRSAQA